MPTYSLLETTTVDVFNTKRSFYKLLTDNDEEVILDATAYLAMVSRGELAPTEGQLSHVRIELSVSYKPVVLVPKFSVLFSLPENKSDIPALSYFINTSQDVTEELRNDAHAAITSVLADANSHSRAGSSTAKALKPFYSKVHFMFINERDANKISSSGINIVQSMRGNAVVWGNRTKAGNHVGILTYIFSNLANFFRKVKLYPGISDAHCLELLRMAFKWDNGLRLTYDCVLTATGNINLFVRDPYNMDARYQIIVNQHDVTQMEFMQATLQHDFDNLYKESFMRSLES